MAVYGHTGFLSGDKPGTKEQIFFHMKAPRGVAHSQYSLPDGVFGPGICLVFKYASNRCRLNESPS
jgi:hypothetical protein